MAGPVPQRCCLEAGRTSSWRQHQVRTWAASGRLRPLIYGLQSVEQRPQFVAKVRELSTKVHHVVTITTFFLLSSGFWCPVALPPRPAFRSACRPASTTCARTPDTELLRAGVNGKIVAKRPGARQREDARSLLTRHPQPADGRQPRRLMCCSVACCRVLPRRRSPAPSGSVGWPKSHTNSGGRHARVRRPLRPLTSKRRPVPPHAPAVVGSIPP